MNKQSQAIMKKLKQKQLHPGVVLFNAPKGVDMDLVAEAIGEDCWDIIFLEKGIVCEEKRVDDVIKAYEDALEMAEEE